MGAFQLRLTWCALATFSPVPLKLITAVALVDELLWIVS